MTQHSDNRHIFDTDQANQSSVLTESLERLVEHREVPAKGQTKIAVSNHVTECFDATDKESQRICKSDVYLKC
jgi:hypothetical protein